MRRLHLILTIGGGFLGIAITLQGLFATSAVNILGYLMFGGFLVLYGFGISIGFRLAEGDIPWSRLALYYWMQVPWISSPLIAFRFTSGAQATLGIINGQLQSSFRIGSEWNFVLFHEAPWAVGVNIFGLVLALFSTRKFWKTMSPEVAAPSISNAPLAPTVLPTLPDTAVATPPPPREPTP